MYLSISLLTFYESLKHNFAMGETRQELIVTRMMKEVLTHTSKVLFLISVIRMPQYTKVWFHRGSKVFAKVFVRRLLFSLLSGSKKIFA